MRNEWQGVEAHDLIRAQLSMFSDLIGKRITIEGPSLRLTPAAAQSIGLALHELATNAGKHGALSDEKGCVAIEWRRNGDRLTFEWSESDGPAVVAPTRKGFGSTVLTQLAEGAVSGEVELNYTVTGVVWRLTCNQCLAALGAPARAKPCKGMAGLLQEGEEVMGEAEEKEDSAADLSLVGAAQKVEHYEIASYTTARNLAQQLKLREVVALLQSSLAEEQNASVLLDQPARPLMSSARMPEPVESVASIQARTER